MVRLFRMRSGRLSWSPACSCRGSRAIIQRIHETRDQCERPAIVNVAVRISLDPAGKVPRRASPLAAAPEHGAGHGAEGLLRGERFRMTWCGGPGRCGRSAPSDLPGVRAYRSAMAKTMTERALRQARAVSVCENDD
jgi:hypothetical protein